MVRKAALALVAVLLLAPAACGTAASTQLARPTVAAPPTEAELTSALLTVGDLPVGFDLDETPPDEDTADPNNSGNPGCSAVFSQIQGSGDVFGAAGASKAAVRFSGGDFGPFLMQSLAGSRDRAALQAAVAGARTLPERCRDYTETDADGVTLRFIFSVAQVTPVGDEAVAVQIAVSGDGGGEEGTDDFSMVGHLVLFRLGGVLCVIAHLGYPGVDVAVTDTIVRAALTKVTPLARPR